MKSDPPTARSTIRRSLCRLQMSIKRHLHIPNFSNQSLKFGSTQFGHLNTDLREEQLHLDQREPLDHLPWRFP